jgi:hypothetical protein
MSVVFSDAIWLTRDMGSCLRRSDGGGVYFPG